MPRLLLILAFAASPCAQFPTDPLREKAAAALQETDEVKRLLLVRDPGATPDFLFALLEQEPSPRLRREILNRIGRINTPHIRQALERLITSDPDASISILALEQLRLQQAQANLALFEQRLRAADPADRAPLAAEHERAVALARGARLPSFFQTPPPTFSLKPADQRIRTAKSPTWRLPATRYTFTAGPVQFFAIDSQAPSQAQWLWLDDELNRSTARWKIVYGHHPIYSHGVHGDTPYLVRDLLPILRHRADIYFAGHDHDLQHLQPEDGVHFFISGGGGAGIRPITPGPRSLFAKSSYGFAVVEAGPDTLQVSYYDPDLRSLYDYTLRK